MNDSLSPPPSATTHDVDSQRQGVLPSAHATPIWSDWSDEKLDKLEQSLNRKRRYPFGEERDDGENSVQRRVRIHRIPDADPRVPIEYKIWIEREQSTNSPPPAARCYIHPGFDNLEEDLQPFAVRSEPARRTTSTPARRINGAREPDNAQSPKCLGISALRSPVRPPLCLDVCETGLRNAVRSSAGRSGSAVRIPGRFLNWMGHHRLEDTTGAQHGLRCFQAITQAKLPSARDYIFGIRHESRYASAVGPGG